MLRDGKSVPDQRPQAGDNPIFAYMHVESKQSCRIEALGLPTGKTRVTADLYDDQEAFIRGWKVLVSELDRLGVLQRETAKSLVAFPEPTSNSLDEWFDWYHKVRPSIRLKLQYVADKTGYAIGTIYKEHSLYMTGREIESEKVKKSKKK